MGTNGSLEGETTGELLGLALSTGVLGGIAALLDLSNGGLTGGLTLLGLLGALLLDGSDGGTLDVTSDLGDLADLLTGNQGLLRLVHLTVHSSPAELGRLVLVQEQTAALRVAEEQNSVIRAHITDAVAGVHLIGGE